MYSSSFYCLPTFPLQIYEAKLGFDIDLGGVSQLYEANGLYDLENRISTFITDILIADTNMLQLGVAVQNQALVPGDTLRIDSGLSLVYVADQPINLFEILEASVGNRNLANALNVENVLVLYEEVVTTTELQDISDDGGKTIGDTGLLVATVILSVTVLAIASILLYVSGGWTAFRKCLQNLCYKEEVIEEKNQIENKRTLPEDEVYDVECRSIAESSIAETNATGILGAVSNDENSNPALDLGIKTPIRHSHDGESNITGFSELDVSEMQTPQSEMTERSISTAALGITSMRKLLHTTSDTENDDGSKQSASMEHGLSYMILDRFKDKK